MKKIYFLLSFLGLFLTVSAQSYQPDVNGTLYVNATAAGNGSGSSWANAIPHLSDALVAAQNLNAVTTGQVARIWVARGSYAPKYNAGGAIGSYHQAFVMVRDVMLYGGFSGTETTLAQRDTTLLFTTNRTLLGSESLIMHHVVIAAGDMGVIGLDGFEITGGTPFGRTGTITVNGETIDIAKGSGIYNAGTSLSVRHCYMHRNNGSTGGGMYNAGGSPLIDQCRFSENYGSGAGIYNDIGTNAVIQHTVFSNCLGSNGGGIYNRQCAPLISHCTFSQNKASSGGAGIYNIASSPVITHCTFTNNTETTGDPATGGGIHNANGSSPQISHCTFTGNSALSGGGAIYNANTSMPAITSCTFINNNASGSSGNGGAIFNSASSPVIALCILRGNVAGVGGGAIYNTGNSSPRIIGSVFSGNNVGTSGGINIFNQNSNPAIVNCTFSDLHLATEKGGIYNNAASPVIINSILWGRNSSILNFSGSNPTVSYSIVQQAQPGVYPGTGNLNTDPLFIAPGTGDYRLQQTSQAIHSGNINITQYGIPAVDIEGNRRTVGGQINIGAYASAYEWPQVLTAAYDGRDTVMLSWQVSKPGASYLGGDNFELRRSTDSLFATNVKVVTASYSYDPNISDYSFTDDITDIRGGQRLFYQLRRTATATDWGWDTSRRASTPVTIHTALAADTSILTESDGPKGIVTWEGIKGVWVTGTKLTIRKMNVTTSATQETIELNEEQARLGEYVDENISYCSEFRYYLKLTLGNDYTSPPEAQVPGTVLAVNIGTIRDLVASKGYFPDRAELRWSAQGRFENYIIKRKVYGSADDFVQIEIVPGTSTSEIQTDDLKGVPGVYYQYMVVGAVNCNNAMKHSRDTLYAIGFRSPTGTIYGRVTYESGQSVENVAVRLQSNDETSLGRSIYLNGDSNSYLKLDSLYTPFADTAFSIEAWIRPDDAAPASQTIFFREGLCELGFDAAGQLAFQYNGISVTGDYRNPNHTFVHVTAVCAADSLFIYLNDSLLAKNAYQPAAMPSPGKAVHIGRHATGNNFKGHIDEMRAWNIALSREQIARNHTRLLAGDEKGLAAYWRFDETITDQFYDLSYRNHQYHKNDGGMDPAWVTRSALAPTPEQLSLKSYTDATGNYMITGIPYTGNGITYTVVPLFGTHQFDPVSVNRLVSASTPSFTVDFKDKSSFPVSGYVYYQHSTVPVKGVQFRIDGMFAQQNNGDIIETDATGRFTISVPVGTHEVKAVKVNHVFANEGKITDRFGRNLNYQEPLSERVLYDSTTIRFIGRVAGGAIEEARPLGHSLSVNNLGKDLSVVMELPSGSVYELYRGTPEAPEKTVTVNHLLPSNETDSANIHRSTIVYQSTRIVIYPDPETGEFAADLIPEPFLATTVNATGWGDLLEGQPVALNFSNKFVEQHVPRGYKDSAQNGTGDWIYTSYADTVKYNDAYQFIKRVTPSVSITQVTNSGHQLPYFGDAMYEARSVSGILTQVPLVDSLQSGKDMYRFGHPVFSQNGRYRFRIAAFEAYPYYENVLPDGTKVIAQQNGSDRIDEVPTQDGHVSLLNGLRDGPASADTISLDASGVALYNFVVGEPDIATAGLKNFAANIRFGQATHIGWRWHGEPQMQAYGMGFRMSGTTFVTAGPDNLLMVLRDPPGSRSFSFAESGTTFTSSSTYSGSVDQVGEETFVNQLGFVLSTFTGVGAGVIKQVDAATGIGFGLRHEEHFTGTNSKTVTSTLTSRYQTSDAPVFVGAAADLFVGYSTNITYGESRNITIIKRTDLKAADILLYEPGPASEYIIIQRDGVNFGENFGTLFAYPQQHIEKVLIPDLLRIRNSALLPPTTPASEAQAAADNTGKQVYVSKLAADDPRFGKSNNDSITFGAAGKNAVFGDGPSYKIYMPQQPGYRNDTIMTLNQFVDNWKRRMADNEEAKLKSSLIQNYSFHAGFPVSHTEQTSVKKDTTYSFNIIISGSVFSSTETKVDGTGIEIKFNESIGTNQGGSFGSSTDNVSTFGFTLASDGTDDFVSVDVNRAADSSFVFRTKGGATACPYEGAVATKYYQPGTLIDQPTQRIEVPRLSVENPVVSSIPSSRKAAYTLYLRNESEARLPAIFVLGYTDNDSVKGATIAVDGTAIGGSGRAVVVQYGETVTKVLTLTKGPDAMDYRNIQILLRSSCQYDPTGYQETIADTVLISAHFIPSCSDIHIKSPADKWVLNRESPVNTQGERYLPLTIDQFDVNNSLFSHIELQYKPASDSRWITAVKFFADSARFNAADGEKQFITNAEAILYNLVMSDGSFNDQAYDIQAVSYCETGPANFVTTLSNRISGVKDTYAPRLFGSPQPANGILGIQDEILLRFNEQVSAGLLTFADFQVTGIRNGAKGDHAVSVKLDGEGDHLATEFSRNLNGKDITAEMWILADRPQNSTLFSHGSTGESMEMAITADHYLEVTIGAKVIRSDRPLPYRQGEWAHVAMVYNAATAKVSAYYNFTEVIHDAEAAAYTGNGHFELGSSIKAQGNTFAGRMHEVRIWSARQTATQLQINSLARLSGAESGLMAYYPMTEAKGSVAFDKAHGANARLQGSWSLPPGKSISFGNGNGYLKINTAFAPVTSAMDYTIELWFRGAPDQSNAVLASNGKGDGQDPGGSFNCFTLGFENGLLTFRQNGFKTQAEGNYLDNNWHHVAIAVNRNAGNGQFFVDGELKRYFDVAGLGGIAAAHMYLGARAWQDEQDVTLTHFDRHFSGRVDEFRLWNSYLNHAIINSNNNVRLKGDELGLLAYYPFERYFEFQNNVEMGYTLSDMKVQEQPNVTVPDAIALNAAEDDETAPVKDRGPVENLQFDYVVNNDELIINMLEPRQAIDKTIVTFKVKRVRDMNGNAIVSPVTWTAYIDRNQLKWSEDALNLTKALYASLEFESDIVNSGGSIQHFRLDNLPVWLTATPSSGVVNPASRQKVTFKVNEGLNTGTYDEIIYMHNDNNEAEALSVKLKVKGNEPDWKADPAMFKYSMTIYGKIRIQQTFSIDPEDMLAAFRNGVCVGVTRNTYFSSNDMWYTFLTVYSDSLQHDGLEFRIWDASTGKTLQALPSMPVSFSNDAIAGTPANPVIFDGLDLFFRDMELKRGWNWISFNLASPSLNSTGATLANGSWSAGDIVKNNDLGFDQYSATQGWTGYLQRFNNINMFMLSTNNAQTLSISGTPVNVAATPIPVKGGRWNYISYLPQVNLTVKEALAGYAATAEDVIKSQTGFAMYDPQNGWVGNLQYLEPGKGYMLYRKDAGNTQFMYPAITGGQTGGRLNPLEIPVQGNYGYAENMTAVAVVDKDFTLMPDDKLLAFAGDELRGKAQLIDNRASGERALFFNISGDTELPLHFKVERGGAVIAESGTATVFRANGTLGTLKQPFVIGMEQLSDHISIYPNPFREQMYIRLDLGKLPSGSTHEIAIAVHNANGQLVYQRPLEKAATGQLLISWNGRNTEGAKATPGIYFIRITIDGKQQVYKVVKI